jgi:putative spermidine/putrescine transport system permease protein
MTRKLSLVVAICVSLYLALPTLVVIPLSFSSAAFLTFPPPGWSTRWYENFFARSEWLVATQHSLVVAVGVTCAATVLGTLAAIGLTRTRFRGSGLINGLLSTPLIVPAIIYAVGSYALFVQFGLVGNLFGLMVAHTALALPFVVVNVSASLRTVDGNAERAARSLGASLPQAFRTVVLPQIAPGVAAGALFAFLTSFNEVVLAIFVTSPATKTLPVQMWSSIRLDLDPTIAAAATLLVAATCVIIAVAAFLDKGNSQ